MGDILHPTSFGQYCVCPVGHPCKGTGCTGMGRPQKFNGFHLQDCPECRCEPRDPQWVKSADAGKIIIMTDGAEGMGSWRFAIAEMLFFARLTGRLLVGGPLTTLPRPPATAT